jgi:tetratricopeptide (TPR) repeat protein
MPFVNIPTAAMKAFEATVAQKKDTDHGGQDSPLMTEQKPEHEVEDVSALIERARELDKPGSYELMLQIAEAAVKQNPGSAEAWACKARALQKLERISEATIANDQALLLDTNLPLAWLNRSGLQLLQQRFPDALRSGERAIELAPKDARVWVNKGLALVNYNDPLGAIEAFNQSLTCDPNYVFALQMKGEILLRLGRIRDVIPTMREAVRISPTDVDSLQLLAAALRSLEEYEELLATMRQLLSVTPESLFARDHEMRALRGLGRYEEALDAIDRVLELDPKDPRTWTFKADTFYRLGRYREAASAAEHALLFDQEYAPARRIHERALKLMYQRKEKKK